MTEERDSTYIPAERLTELILSVAELNDLSDMLKDDDVDQTLGYIIKLLANPNIPANIAAPLVVKLTAMSVAFNLKAKMYQFRAKGDKEATEKKNLYYSLSDGTEKLAAALKYIVRN